MHEFYAKDTSKKIKSVFKAISHTCNSIRLKYMQEKNLKSQNQNNQMLM